MVSNKDFTSVAFPKSLKASVEEIIEKYNLPYTNPTEFIKEAVRYYIFQIEKIKVEEKISSEINKRIVDVLRGSFEEKGGEK